MEGDGAGTGPGVNASTSSERIATGGRRISLRLVAALVAGCLGIGVVLTWDGSGGSRDRGEPGRGDDQTRATGIELEVTEASDTMEAYTQAALRLGRARTFAYRGTVRSRESSLVRPGPWLAHEVTVEGAVHLPLSITTEVAVGPDGSAVQTVTSGSGTWARRAPRRAGLATAPWAVLADDRMLVAGRRVVGAPLSRLGIARVVDAVQAGGDRRSAPRDGAGRRVIRATVPEHRGGQVGRRDLADIVGGAELAVTLDDVGDVARVELSTAPGRPELVLTLDIDRLGDPDLIRPADFLEPIESTLPPGVLGQVGIGSVDAPGLPDTWALTDAAVYEYRVSTADAPAGCHGGILLLTYHDLARLGEGELAMSLRRDTCDEDGLRVGSGRRPGDVAVRAARFSGSARETSDDEFRGEVTDGTTALAFTTDLPLHVASAAIASLLPADVVGAR